MKKVLIAIISVLVMQSNANALFFDSSCDYSPITDPITLADDSQISSLYAQSRELADASSSLLALTLSMQDGTSSATMVTAMLALSEDILTMADKIGEMADRIIATELQIGLMADRILQTQALQSNNLALTQANILKAQENLNALLLAMNP